ncbi:MAG: ABC transporter permease [Ruminococcaceae bacterium]|nr:ABC transporter permease [Oscillospiraceae bacterium]
MKRGFYLKLALDGMKKNKRLYIPYLLTCAGMVMMFYILYGLAMSPLMETMRGGNTMGLVLMLGTWVILLFSLLFLLYTNSFLARRRNKEFGLYNILGMNKRNLSRILLWETLLCALFSIGAGLAGGILLSKLAELFLLHMAGEQADFALRIVPKGILAAILFYGAIFAVLMVISLARLHISRPLDLLKSEAAGEKPPKANWLFALAGVIILGVAYYLAVTIESPLTAVTLFFAAVLMVIVATYLLFIAGSVALCKLLQKKKGYYYKPNHFVSVSSMAFRMKRNGAGLAAICILATMVLVMLSSTSCLYFGGDDALRGSYPYDVMTVAGFNAPADCTPEVQNQLEEIIQRTADGHAQNSVLYSVLDTSGSFEDGVLDPGGFDRRVVSSSASALEAVRSVCILPLSDYNRLAGTNRTLAPGEALLWSSNQKYDFDTFAVKGCRTLQIREQLDSLPIRIANSAVLATTYFVIVPDWTDYCAEVSAYVTGLGSDMITADTEMFACFDLPGLSEAEQCEIQDKVSDAAQDVRDPGWRYFSTASLADNRSDFFSTYGSLFFLGIILSIVFIAAAALIIYYKQLSEGYEDQSRFGVMQKVGMTKKEIRRAVNSQVITVFFAPLALAGVHLAFAFPFVQKIVRLFGVFNTRLLILTSIICFLAFALFYVFVYRRTAKAYYSIVSDTTPRQ